jgi:hypothetical protein
MRAVLLFVGVLASPQAVAQVETHLDPQAAEAACQPALLCEAGLVSSTRSMGWLEPGTGELREGDGASLQEARWAGVATLGALEEAVSVTDGLGSVTSALHLGDRLTLWSEAFVNTMQPQQLQPLQFGWLQAVSVTLAESLFLDIGVDVGPPGAMQSVTSFVLLSFDRLHRSMVPSFLSTSGAFTRQARSFDEDWFSR